MTSKSPLSNIKNTRTQTNISGKRAPQFTWTWQKLHFYSLLVKAALPKLSRRRRGFQTAAERVSRSHNISRTSELFRWINCIYSLSHSKVEQGGLLYLEIWADLDQWFPTWVACLPQFLVWNMFRCICVGLVLDWEGLGLTTVNARGGFKEKWWEPLI